MELTQAEARLISSMREIDRQNPAGVDGFSELAYLDIFQRMIDGAAAEAARRYQLFLNQAKGGSLIDLKEAQRSKSPHEDTRARAEDKAKYERAYKEWGLPAPEWEPGAPSSRSAAVDPGREGPGKEWAQMTEAERAAHKAREWAEAEPGTMEHAIKHLEAPAAAIAAALEVMEAIRQACADEAAAEGLRNEFDHETAPDLLEALRRRSEADRQQAANG